MERADLVGVERNSVAFLVTVVGGIGSDAGEDESSDKEEQRRWYSHVSAKEEENREI